LVSAVADRSIVEANTSVPEAAATVAAHFLICKVPEVLATAYRTITAIISFGRVEVTAMGIV
jgi:hypothetical protein